VRSLLIILLVFGPQDSGATITGKVSATEGKTQEKIPADIHYAGPGSEKRKLPDPSPAVVYLLKMPASKSEAQVLEIKQEGLEFRPRVLAVRVGDTVKFPNGDDVYHNVFSYSKAKRFDLGRYPRGQSNEVTFDEKGLVEVRCEIHKHMRAYIHVFDHPYYALAKEDGTYSIAKVPPGKYTLVVWKEFFEPVRREVEVKGDGAKADFDLTHQTGPPVGRETVASCCGAQ
jgi:plastocyanin